VATFVLIPGAGTDPRVYDATIEALGALGHGGLAPALPLDDADAAPSDHADAVVRALPADGKLVVAAQSLGAFAGSLVAARAPVAQLVLVAPMIPRPGETAGEWWASTGHEEAIADLLERHGPMSSWGPDAIAEVFLHDVDPGVSRDNERYQGVPGDGLFGEPWPTEDRLFPLEFQRRVARERLGLEIDEIPGGHLPMLSRPRELAERLIELAQRGQGAG
jgi:pimeloyl-ACP methyl ester carboxylesterase